jgi:hypothetical protein
MITQGDRDRASKFMDVPPGQWPAGMRVGVMILSVGRSIHNSEDMIEVLAEYVAAERLSRVDR